MGSYYIPTSSHSAFLKVYKAAIERGEDVFLTERHRHIGPVVVDLDFRFEPLAEEQGAFAKSSETIDSPRAGPSVSLLKRRHSVAVDEIVNAYCRAMAELIETPDEFDVYVTEKKTPSTWKGLVKDGLHILAPSVITRPALQLLLRKDVLGALSEVFKPLNLYNKVEDVVDEAVIERNNWMMYGSKKPGGEPYAVTRRYRYTYSPEGGDKSTLHLVGAGEELPSLDYVELLSIRNKYDELRVREAQRDRAELFVAKLEDDRRRRDAVKSFSSIDASLVSQKLNNQCDDFEQVCKLVDLLDPSRVETYDGWMKLGWCLRNIDHRLLEAWVEVSKKSPKYTEGECPRVWNTMRTGGLGVGTLHMWAKQDAPDRYRALLRTNLVGLIKGCTGGAHYDVACVVHHLYKHEFVCCSIKPSQRWYEFREHRWHECDGGHSLRKHLSTDVYREICAVAEQIVRRMGAVFEDDANQSEERKMLAEHNKKLCDLALKLKTTKFKDDVMKECSELFYVERFENKLDANVDLLGFENGVYDLERMEFREGRPDDYVSFSTLINYVPYAGDEHYVVKEITKYWDSVHPNKEVRDYILKSISSCLSGRIREERFNIWTGSGSNSKSVSVNLLEKTLGNYCCKFPVTLLTQKRAVSNAATPEIARAKGRRFAVLQEPSEDERLNVGLMKELSGGDTVQTRELFKGPVEWKPQFKLFLLCNNLPNVPSDDGGTWRRIRVVEFGSKFCESPNPDKPNEFPMDPDLMQKLDGWREHFMAILLRYYKRYVDERKLVDPESVLQCTRDYQKTNDHMAEFVDNCIEKVDGNDSLPLDDVFFEFKEWVKKDQVPIKVPKKGVVQKYLDRALNCKVSSVRGKAAYRGFKMRDREGGGEEAEL